MSASEKRIKPGGAGVHSSARGGRPRGGQRKRALQLWRRRQQLQQLVRLGGWLLVLVLLLLLLLRCPLPLQPLLPVAPALSASSMSSASAVPLWQRARPPPATVWGASHVRRRDDGSPAACDA